MITSKIEVEVWEPAETGETKGAEGSESEEGEHDQALVGGGEGLVPGGETGDVGEQQGKCNSRDRG